MRYRLNTSDDRVSHLIGQCLRSKADAERIYDILVNQEMRKIDLITGSIHLSPQEHAEFVSRYSAEVQPTIWESSFRKQ
jgi:hypothetical protein